MGRNGRCIGRHGRNNYTLKGVVGYMHGNFGSRAGAERLLLSGRWTTDFQRRIEFFPVSW
jgi:hypothetical protein